MVVSGICMLETNVNNSSEKNKADADFKTEIKSYSFKEEIKDIAIIIFSSQIKEVKVHARRLK